MKKLGNILAALAITCFLLETGHARSKKSQARIDKRKAAYAESAKIRAETGLINEKSKYVRQETTKRQMDTIQIQHQRGIQNGNQYRKAKAQRKRKYIGY